MDKKFAWLGTDDHVGRHSAVRAPDPKDRWSLTLSLFDKIVWINPNFLVSPFCVVFKEFVVENLLKIV